MRRQPRRPPRDLADQRHARAVGQVEVRRRVEHHQVGARPTREVADVVAAAAPPPRRRSPRAAPRPGVIPISRTASATHERHRAGVARAGVAVGRQRHPDPGVEQRRGRPGRATGSRTPPRAAASRPSRSRPARRRRRRRGRCSGRPRRARARRPAAPRARGRAGWRAAGPRSPAAAPAARTARAWSASNAPALAEHVDPPGVRRAGLEHRPGHQVDVRRPGRRRTPAAPRARRGTWSPG